MEEVLVLNLVNDFYILRRYVWIDWITLSNVEKVINKFRLL